MQTVSIALLGFGVVGTGVYQILTENRNDILHREELAFDIRHILVRNREKAIARNLAPKELITTEFSDILHDDSVSIVVECMGGVDPAKAYILEALSAGKTVVTSNKEVMSKHWPEFEAAARTTGAGLYLEGTVAGGIPIIRTVIDSLQANNISRIMGIINGTTNFILTNMAEAGLEFSDVLSEAQALGYAEADPTADVEGFDAMYKLSLLSSIAFHAHIPINVVYREGITKLTKEDFDTAKLLGYTIKLLAIGKKTPEGIEVRVHPTMLPNVHPLASVRGSFNAVFLTGHAVGDVMLYGRGAGCLPTASAVVSDIVYASHILDMPRYMTFQNTSGLSKEVSIVKDFHCVYCVRMHVTDQPGTMAAVADTFAKHGVSLKSVLQLGEIDKDYAHITFMTHMARELSFQAAISDIRALSCVQDVESIIRVEE